MSGFETDDSSESRRGLISAVNFSLVEAPEGTGRREEVSGFKEDAMLEAADI